MIRKLNNKGFAITGILYTLFILFILTLLSILSGLQIKKQTLEKATEKVENSYQGIDVSSDADLGLAKVSSTRTASVTGKYVFELDSSANLLYGLYDVENVSAERMKYSVSNKVITVTATGDDGYGSVNASVYLEAGKSYTFSCTSTGTLGGNGGDTVEVFLLYNGGYEQTPDGRNSYLWMGNLQEYHFQPLLTGNYILRLDVNQNGKTYQFSQFKITMDGEKTTCSTYLNRGDAIVQGDVVFLPRDCNDYSYTFDFINQNPEGLKMTLKKIYSFEGE